MFYGSVSSYIEFPNKGGLETLFSTTLMCWVQPGGQDGPLFNYGRYYPWRFGIWIMYGRFSYEFMNPTRTPESLPTGKWVHVAASYDHDTKYSSLYVNGHLRASKYSASRYRDPADAYEIRMGSARYGSNHFKGKITEMKVYDVALNEAQIQTLIRQGSCTFPLTAVFLPIR